jgi:hypothetical protein
MRKRLVFLSFQRRVTLGGVLASRERLERVVLIDGESSQLSFVVDNILTIKGLMGGPLKTTSVGSVGN